MKDFLISTGISEYTTFSEFAKENALGQDDLFIASASVFEKYIKPIVTDAKVIIPRKFGQGEPSDVMVDALLREAATYTFKRIIAVGGGATLDMSKLVAVAEADDNTDSLFEKGVNLQKRHELVLIPTTCGTGSEVTNISVVNRLSKGTKMGLAVPALFADKAVLIPELLDSMPYQVFATSTIDAMVHSVESYLSPNRCYISEIFSEKALRIMLRSWKDTVATGNWQRKTTDYLRAANLAGIGFGYGGCAAVHACAYPLGGIHHVPHGQSNQLMFAAVMKKYRSIKADGRLAELEDLLAEELDVKPENALTALYELMDKILPLKPLREVGVTEDELPLYAASVIKQQQRLLKNSYLQLSEDDLLEIYQSAF